MYARPILASEVDNLTDDATKMTWRELIVQTVS